MATSLPDPLTPPDCDLRDVEPPWPLFVQLAMDTYGVSRAEAEAVIFAERDEFRRAVAARDTIQ